MNAEQYLKEEFQVYPSSFRDVSNYMVREDNAINVRHPLGFLASSGLSSLASQIEVEISGDNHVACLGDLRSRPQSETFVAVWELLSMKKSPAIVANPAINNPLMESRVANFSLAENVKWLADIDFLIIVWKQHKKSKNYSRLNVDDALFIEAIGLIYRVLRKNVAEDLRISGFELSEESNLALFKDSQLLTRKDRMKYYPRFKEQLSNDFKVDILKLINL